MSLFVAMLAAVPGAGAEAPAAAAKPTPKAEKEPLPEPVNETLKTKDGVDLKVTFYPGTMKKDSVPVIILHEWKGSRDLYKELALSLQARGCAVIVPDLRGHGESTHLQPDPKGPATTLNPNRMKKADIQLMITQDLETVKSYLKDRNNAGELNLEKLCIIGVELGSIVAMNWAVLDWNAKIYPTYKYGQDVKALVLISPEWSNRGLSIVQAMDHPKIRKELACMVLVGENDKRSLQAAERINAMLGRYHDHRYVWDPKTPAPKESTLFLVKLKTSLGGAKLINTPELLAPLFIAEFIQQRLVNESMPWSKRIPP